jgi:MerR family transcriptional regulator/heat shock protein HspR
VSEPRATDRPTEAEDRGGVYTIAVAARLTGMHPQTLRKYERAGLLRPSRHAGNQRFYSDADIRRLRRIQYLVGERGLNVAGLELALAMSDRLDALEPEASRAEMQTAIDEVSEMSRERRFNDEPPPEQNDAVEA